MSTDYIFLLSVFAILFSLPFVIADLLSKTMPKASLVLLIAGGIGLFYAVSSTPDPYTWRDVPRIVVDFIAEVF